MCVRESSPSVLRSSEHSHSNWRSTDGLSEVLWVWLQACAGIVSMRTILLLQETFTDLATECTEKV